MSSTRHGLPHCRLVRCCIHQFTAATENSNKLKHSRMPFARASLRPAELLMMLSPLRLARTCIFLAQCTSTSDILLVDWHNAFHTTVQSLADAISIVVGAGLSRICIRDAQSASPSVAFQNCDLGLGLEAAGRLPKPGCTKGFNDSDIFSSSELRHHRV